MEGLNLGGKRSLMTQPTETEAWVVGDHYVTHACIYWMP